ncbi:uncharacterized protein PITG_17466 [Phytophthora infestans T30-4]|uniref:Uncharacterized protein n=1 Tax=Phytophthora infestans (strain T30-4) TaxID=403677 RepID=D0NW42_PHYIT|nr:uncharacterized protein PITG_17466 [Phytophthora infestans T30-4]EEY66884.1 hypothetical protein PITG_17466 [Phytophthora infestans T30-4]|eukprot:XP_002896693.1 hypothetical protein PITG_17466 [Phytophthora infestans T30-4]
MIGIPTLRVNLWGGIPLIFIEWSTSCSKKLPSPSSCTESEDMYSRACPVNRSVTASLMRCTIAFVVVRIVRLAKYSSVATSGLLISPYISSMIRSMPLGITPGRISWSSSSGTGGFSISISRGIFM